MVRQPFDLVVQPVPRLDLQDLDDAGMQGPPPLIEQRAVSYLMGEGVLEGIGELGKETRLIQELGGLQVREARPEELGSFPGKISQEHEGHLGANHCGHLDEALVLGCQRVDPGR